MARCRLRGGGVVAVCAVLAVLACVADVVQNKRLYRTLFDWSMPIGVIGAGLLILGVGGWWTVYAAAGLTVFGWLVRPRTKEPK